MIHLTNQKHYTNPILVGNICSWPNEEAANDNDRFCATGSILIRGKDGKYRALARKDFSGKTRAGAEKQTKEWAKAKHDEIAAMLGAHFKVESRR